MLCFIYRGFSLETCRKSNENKKPKGLKLIESRKNVNKLVIVNNNNNNNNYIYPAKMNQLVLKEKTCWY